MTFTRILSISLVTVVVMMGCFAPAMSSEPLKVICAKLAEKPPVIDGVLDDACWAKSDIRSDFVTPGISKPTSQRTSIRCAYDAKNLYVGIEFYWDDIEQLKAGIKSIIAKRGKAQPGVRPIANFENSHSLELFIDQGASRANAHQLLYNAAGQRAGNFNAIEKFFTKTLTIRSTVGKDRWTVEIAWPVDGKALVAGDVWGMNLIRNDEMCNGMWAFINGAFHQPQLFGRIVMGSYAEWWNAVFAKGVADRLIEIRKGMAGSKDLQPLYDQAKIGADRLTKLAKKHQPNNRENFEILYRAYSEFNKNMTRLDAAYQIYQQMEAI
jgi:hypothetical protein